MPIRQAAAAVSLLASAAASAGAGSFTVPLVQSQSTVTVTLSVTPPALPTRTGTDSSQATGYFVIDVDSFGTPTQIWLFDNRVALTKNLAFNLSWGLAGVLTVNANNLVFLNASPGTVQGPVPIGPTGAFTFPAVPSKSSGTIAYNATGLLCTALQAQTPPTPCNSTTNLADNPPGTEALSGVVTIAGRVVTLTSASDTTSPLDPTQPALGSLRVVTNLRASATIPLPPCPGDADGNRSVGAADLSAVLVAYGTAPGQPGWDPRADLDGNSAVGAADLTLVLVNYGTTCPDH
ncbi:MAG: hypothetical protein IBJ11_02545 [Phycisphaerales bacterium]|nr:hypothetical protein [Phycisphaerales bacterium]